STSALLRAAAHDDGASALKRTARYLPPVVTPSTGAARGTFVNAGPCGCCFQLRSIKRGCWPPECETPKPSAEVRSAAAPCPQEGVPHEGVRSTSARVTGADDLVVIVDIDSGSGEAFGKRAE